MEAEKGKGELIIKEDQEIGQIGYKVYWCVALPCCCADCRIDVWSACA